MAIMHPSSQIKTRSSEGISSQGHVFRGHALLLRGRRFCCPGRGCAFERNRSREIPRGRPSTWKTRGNIMGQVWPHPQDVPVHGPILVRARCQSRSRFCPRPSRDLAVGRTIRFRGRIRVRSVKGSPPCPCPDGHHKKRQKLSSLQAWQCPRVSPGRMYDSACVCPTILPSTLSSRFHL